MEPRIRAIEIVDDRVVEILRSKTPAERLAIADGMWSFARQMIRAIQAREHPDWSQGEIDREVARRMSHGAF
jgi:2-polyprenyl-6-methoxyphenol hydroxylase-like FAD-dependent oxidoreductase